MITSVVKQLGYRALRRAAIGSWSLRATRLPLCIDHRYRYTLGKRTGATARHLHLHNIRTYNYKRTHIFTAVVPAHSRHNSVTQLTTCISQPRWRWPHSNSNKAFGIKKLESLSAVCMILLPAILVEHRLVTDTDTRRQLIARHHSSQLLQLWPVKKCCHAPSAYFPEHLWLGV